MAGRQRVAAGVGAGGDAVDVEQAGHRLLLEPLARVAGIDAGAGRELGRASRGRDRGGRRTGPSSMPSWTDSRSKVAEQRLEQATRERVTAGVVVGVEAAASGAVAVTGVLLVRGDARWSLVRRARQRYGSGAARQASGPNASG